MGTYFTIQSSLIRNLFEHYT